MAVWAVLSLLSSFLLIAAQPLSVSEDGGVVVAFGPSLRPDDMTPDFCDKLKGILSNMSAVLYGSTAGPGRRGLYLKEVSLLLPADISPQICGGILDDQPSDKVIEEADILVESTGPFDQNPFTVQHDHCGFSGHRIVLPLPFVTADHIPEITKAKHMVQEWLQYRYGVFKELGFEDDPRYPLLSSLPGRPAQMMITECLNEPHSEQFKDQLNLACRGLVDQNTGLLGEKSAKCRYDKPEESLEPLSSILSHATLPTVNQLCGLDPDLKHDGTLPSKHNILCGEDLSPGDVIMMHADFNFTSETLAGLPMENGQFPPDPTFKVTQMEELQIVLVVSEDRTLAKNGEAEKLRGYIKKFLRYDLPRKSSYGVVGFRNGKPEEKIKIQPWKDMGIPLFSFQNQATDRWLLDGAKKAVEMFSSPLVARNSRLIVLLGKGVSTYNLEQEYIELTQELRKRKIRVFFLLLADSLVKPELPVFKLCSDTGGRMFFLIRDLQDSITDMDTQITEAFLQISYFSKVNKPLMLAHRYVTSEESSFSLSIGVPPNLENLEFLIKPSVLKEDSFKLWQPNNLQVVLGSVVNEYGNEVYSFNAPAVGRWQLDGSMISEEFPVVFLGKYNPSSPPITLESWVSSQWVDKASGSQPVKIFAELRQGVFPVAGAFVRAFVYPPNQRPYSLDLRDDGLGIPDITARDGIYSRYLVTLSDPGLYRIFVVANVTQQATVLKENRFVISTTLHPFGSHVCCGSRVTTDQEENVAVIFAIQAPPQNLVVTQPFGKLFPPGNVTDLKVIAVEHDRRTLSLSWTEPGGVLDSGKATAFSFKFSRQRMSSFQDESSSALLWNPPEGMGGYGTTHKLTLNFDDIPRDPSEQWEYPLTVYIALTTLNGHRSSGLSNIVAAYLDPVLVTTSPSSDFTTSEGSQKDLDVAGVSWFKENFIYLLIGCILVFIILVIFIIVLICFLRKKRRNREKDVSSTYAPPSIPQDHNSNSPVDKLNGTNGIPPSAIHTIATPNSINPIQSWPAEVLLDHYDKVKDAKKKKVAPPILSIEDVMEEISLASGSCREGPSSSIEGSTEHLDMAERQVTQV